MKPLPGIHNLSQAVNMFNRGCASFRRAMQAFENKNSSEFQTALQGAARDVPDVLEWVLKIYLENFPDLDLEDRRKLDKPTFRDLLDLMDKYADPPLTKETRMRLFGYRSLRNKITHHGAIPPVEEVRNVIEETRRIILTYFPGVEEDHLKKIGGLEGVEGDEDGRVTSERPGSVTSSDLSKQYNFKNIRVLLTEGFSDEELRHLCFDVPAFRPVHSQLAKGSGKSEIIQRLLEYVEQKDLIEILLDQAKERNPAKYQTYQPYFEDIHRTDEKVTEPSTPLWPATLPWNEPYYKLPERDVELEKIVEQLRKREAQWGVFVSGLGGIGKTATAIEIGRRCMAAHAFERILGDSAKLDFLVDGRIAQADDKAVLNFENFLNELGTQLDRPDLRVMPIDEKRHILSRLLSQASYLVIVDNLETVQNAAQIVRELPQLLGRSQAIVTSREIISTNTIPLSLKSLDEADALFFLREDAQTCRCDDVINASDAVLREVNQAVEGQPLALKLVVAQAANFGLKFALKNIKNTRGDIYRFIYWDSWQKLSLPAQEVLIYLGGAPTSVSLEELLEVPFSIEADNDLAAAVNQLIKLSLISVIQTESKKRYAIHELTRSFINSDLPELWNQQGTV